MKSIPFLIPLFFFTLQMQEFNIAQSIKFNISLPDTIYKGQQCIPIILKIENISSEAISIRNPVHWGNTYPRLIQGEKDVHMIKVKENPLHLKEIIRIVGYGNLGFNFDFTLDYMVNLDSLPTGKYELHFQMRATKPIESNVFTFYLKER